MEIKQSEEQEKAKKRSNGTQRVLAAMTSYIIALFLLLTVLIGFDYGAKLSFVLYPFALYFLVEGVRFCLTGGDLLKGGE